MALFTIPPLIMSTAHLLTESPHSVDFAVQFVVLAAVLVLVADTAGHRVAWGISAPLAVACLVGVLVHRIGDAGLDSTELAQYGSSEPHMEHESVQDTHQDV